MGAKRRKKRGIKRKAVLSKILERTAQNRVIFRAGTKKKKSRNPHGYWIFRWRKRWDSNPRAREGYLISSLLVILQKAGSFVTASGLFVCAKSRMKSGFFALKASLYLRFVKVGSNRHFCGFWGENREDRGEKTEEGNTKIYTPQNRASNRQNLCSRCIK